jgi:hypothetical protein
MLRHVFSEMSKMILADKSLEDIMAAGIARQRDDSKGDPSHFLERSYTSLTHRHAGH